MKIGDYIGWILMAGALLVGLLAFYMVRQYIAAEEDKLRAAVDGERGRTQRVVVASRNLPSGTVIRAGTMAIGEVPERHTPSRVVTPPGFEALQGRVLTRPMAAGEPLLADFVSGVVIERFSDLIEPGYRALSLEATALETHAGMLVPGDFIDLFVVVDNPAPPKRKQLLPVLERVKVIAAGPEPLRSREQNFQPLPEQASRYNLISVAVAAADAERITLARHAGELAYLLRNAQDARLLASEGGRRFFDEPEAHRGYLYFSNTMHHGERRNAPDVEDLSQHASQPLAQLPLQARSVDDSPFRGGTP